MGYPLFLETPIYPHHSATGFISNLFRAVQLDFPVAKGHSKHFFDLGFRTFRLWHATFRLAGNLFVYTVPFIFFLLPYENPWVIMQACIAGQLILGKQLWQFWFHVLKPWQFPKCHVAQNLPMPTHGFVSKWACQVPNTWVLSKHKKMKIHENPSTSPKNLPWWTPKCRRHRRNETYLVMARMNAACCDISGTLNLGAWAKSQRMRKRRWENHPFSLMSFPYTGFYTHSGFQSEFSHFLRLQFYRSFPIAMFDWSIKHLAEL